MRIRKYILRFLSSPFILCLFLIANISASFVATWNFIIYGGEVIRYMKDDKESIHELFLIVKKAEKNLKQEINASSND